MEPATKLVVIVGLHFMILFTAFSAFQNIVTKIHEDEGDSSLGPFTFAVNYFAFMVANLFVSKTKYSEKWLITFATFPYAINYSTGFFMQGTPIYVKYILAAFGSTINGIASSFLWTNVGSYIHKVCLLYGKEKERGHYFGLFNTIFCVSTVLGSILVTFGLSLFNHSIYFIIVSGVALFAFAFGIFFIKDIKLNSVEFEEHEEEENNIGAWQRAKLSFKSIIHFYPKMKYSLGLIFIDGINIGVTTGTILHLMPKNEDQKQDDFNAGTCLFMYGIGCVIGGYIGGRVSDRFKIKLSSTIALLLYSFSCLFSMIASQIFELWSAQVSSFIWGVTMYFLSANLMVICSKLYGGKPESFAITKQLHCFSFVIYQLVSMGTKNSLPVLYIMLAIIFFSLPAFWGVHKCPEEKSKETDETPDDQITSSETDTAKISLLNEK